MVGISLLNSEAGTAPNGSSVVRPNAFGWAQPIPDVQSFVKRSCAMILRARKPFSPQQVVVAAQWPSSCFEGL